MKFLKFEVQMGCLLLCNFIYCLLITTVANNCGERYNYAQISDANQCDVVLKYITQAAHKMLALGIITDHKPLKKLLQNFSISLFMFRS